MGGLTGRHQACVLYVECCGVVREVLLHVARAVSQPGWLVIDRVIDGLTDKLINRKFCVGSRCSLLVFRDGRSTVAALLSLSISECTALRSKWCVCWATSGWAGLDWDQKTGKPDQKFLLCERERGWEAWVPVDKAPAVCTLRASIWHFNTSSKHDKGGSYALMHAKKSPLAVLLGCPTSQSLGVYISLRPRTPRLSPSLGVLESGTLRGVFC